MNPEENQPSGNKVKMVTIGPSLKRGGGGGGRETGRGRQKVTKLNKEDKSSCKRTKNTYPKYPKYLSSVIQMS